VFVSRYAYLLGIYLGDGHVGVHGRTARFVVTLDAVYPQIIDERVDAIGVVNAGVRVSQWRRPQHACVIVSSYSKRWLDLFPQHGPGPKHERPIVLEPWQEAIVSREPEALLRG
jgi:hypothetical protein